MTQAFFYRDDCFEATALGMDRGLMYGDGLFETIRVVDHMAILWPFHRQRMLLGAQRLFISLEADWLDALLNNCLAQLLPSNGAASAIVKIMLTRGIGGRGYWPSEILTPSVIVVVSPLPVYPQHYYQAGIDTTICQYRLSSNAYLAGIKHLNRLDQVLISRELDRFPEGIVLNQSGMVIEGSRSSLLIECEGDVFTPKISDAGVNGVMTAFLRESQPVTGISINEADITPDALKSNCALAFVNSVFGLWPVKSIDGHPVEHGTKLGELQHYLHERLGFPGRIA